jgi:hypothetical protein
MGKGGLGDHEQLVKKLSEFDVRERTNKGGGGRGGGVGGAAGTSPSTAMRGSHVSAAARSIMPGQ